MLSLALAALFCLQRHGFFPGSARDRMLRVPIPERFKGKAAEIDDRILQFYRESRRHFLLSVGAYLAGWLLGAVEVAAIAYLVGCPFIGRAMVLEAFVGVGKIFAVVVPGALSAKRGILVLCRAVGLADAFARTTRFSVGPEVVFALIGGLTIYFEELTLKDLRREISVTGQK